ncbi:MAG: PepSY domain-containing protein [Anaerolineales bacterium]|nr:PepSY domain-containing protein [Anaerolineales bacterium]
MSPARPEPAEPTARASQAPGAGVRGVYADIKVTPEQAYDLFKGLYPTAQVKQLELDLQDHAYYAYEVEGYEGNTEYEVKIDALDARILKQEQGRHDGSGGEVLRADLARIPELITAALQDAGAGFSVKDWEAAVKRGRVVFQVELLGQGGREIEYQFDLQTGDLLQKDV